MSDDPLDRYEVVIGLEVHTHLKTNSKLFSPAPVRYGDAPNHDVHPIDLGMPGCSAGAQRKGDRSGDSPGFGNP